MNNAEFYKEMYRKECAETERLRSAAARYLLAVKRLGEDSGYNKLTYFEAPISQMPTDDLAHEAQVRWVELNDAGKALKNAMHPPRPLSNGE